MKKSLCLVLSIVMALASVSAIAEQTVPEYNVVADYESVPVAIFDTGVSFLAPTDWTSVELAEEDVAEGYFYSCVAPETEIVLDGRIMTIEDYTMADMWEDMSVTEGITSLTQIVINGFAYMVALYDDEEAPMVSMIAQLSEGVFVSFDFWCGSADFDAMGEITLKIAGSFVATAAE